MFIKSGFGLANEAWSTPSSIATAFRICSVSKQFTAMLIMRLVEDGRLALDATLSELPSWYRKDTGGRVTVHQLLSHTSGISFIMPDGFFTDTPGGEVTIRQLIEKWHSGESEFEPGTSFR